MLSAWRALGRSGFPIVPDKFALSNPLFAYLLAESTSRYTEKVLSMTVSDNISVREETLLTCSDHTRGCLITASRSTEGCMENSNCSQTKIERAPDGKGT